MMTTSDLIDALGGTARVAEITGVGMSAVSNWRKFDRLPPRLYLRIATVGRERGIEVPERLFKERRAETPQRETAA